MLGPPSADVKKRWGGSVAGACGQHRVGEQGAAIWLTLREMLYDF